MIPIHYRTSHAVRAELAAATRRALVVTTVVHESRAVHSHLTDVEWIAGSNGVFYQFGKFADPAGDWHVIHAICQAGNVDAAVTIGGAHRDFGDFHVQMFVGVAGSLKQDVPIGSVVVGNYVYYSSSSKIDNKGEYSRPHNHVAAPELLQAATMLVFEGSWTGSIRPPHLGALPSTNEYPCPFPPQAHIKAIVSGEQVVAGEKSATFKKLREDFNDAAAVEMEGYGAMSAAHRENTPAIVIRGISDMCGGKQSKKDAAFQPIASAHAAAFAFSVLSVRSRIAPDNPQSVAQVQTPTAELQTAAVIDTRSEFVLNLKGSLLDWPEDRIGEVLQAIRMTTGDPDVTLARVEDGSVRLVLRIRDRDISKLAVENIRSAIRHEGAVLGALPASQVEVAAAAKLALAKASKALLLWDQTLPNKAWIDRPEKQQIESYQSRDSSSLVLLGDPGSGKSALLSSIANELVRSGAAVLAVKADLLSPVVSTERDLQEELGLPDLPSSLIEQLARLQPTYLIVDQLDALATQLDLKSDRLNVLLNLVRRLGGLANVHILMSARRFEFAHDVRLRAIDAEAIGLSLPPWHKINEQLASAGIDGTAWPNDAREVIRSPQALKTYLSLADNKALASFSTYQSMLAHQWRQRISDAPDGDALSSLATDLAHLMAEEETLWLAASRFDSKSTALNRLEAIGLIVRSENGQTVGFSHQTVFDYVLARGFVRSTGHLSTYVLERQNSLFVRAKLWSALNYLRETEIGAYQREFTAIWERRDLRLHLRLLLIEFLGELQQPLAFEKLWFDDVLNLPDTRIAGLKAIIGSPGWFETLKGTAIPDAMRGDDNEARHALGALRQAWAFAPDDVVRLIRERWLNDSAKDHLSWAALDACPAWTEGCEDVARTILLRTPVGSWHVNHTVSAVSIYAPDMAFRLVASSLSYLLTKATSRPSAPADPLTSELETPSERRHKPFTTILESTDWADLPAMAETHPEAFLRALWPWFRTVFEELRRCVDDSPSTLVFPGQYLLSVDFESTDERSLRDAQLLFSLFVALQSLAPESDSYFREWVASNSDLDLMIVQRLVAYGLSASAQRNATLALSWILEDSRRLQLGSYVSRRDTTATLVSAAAPFWSAKELLTFEAYLDSYDPSPASNADVEARQQFLRFIRKTKAHILSVIPNGQLSDAAKESLSVAKRALGENLASASQFSGGGFIGSPMESQSMIKARDRDILKMFEEVPDSAGWDHPERWMEGGNIQLSRAFGEFSKAEPIRALRLLEHFEPGAQERAAGYALESIAESDGHDKLVLAALIDLDERGFHVDEFRVSAANAIEKIAGRTHIEEPIIQVLMRWLNTADKETSEPGKNKPAEDTDSAAEHNSRDDRPQSILWGMGGVSFLPQGNYTVLSALTSILLHGESGRDRLFQILDGHFDRENDPSVWRALLLRLTNAGGRSPQVVSQFVRKVAARFPSVFESTEAVQFLAYALRWDDDLTHDMVLPWAGSAEARLRQAYGELIGLASITKNTARWEGLLKTILNSDLEDSKVGLAFSASNLWSDATLHDAAGNILVRLIPGASKERMFALLDVFRLCNELSPDASTLALLRGLSEMDVDLTESPSIFIVEKLQSLLPYASDIVGEIALKLVGQWRAQLVSIQTATAVAAPQLTDLALTLHRLPGNSKELGVSIFEALIDMDAYGARDTLNEIDARFPANHANAPPRIPRRRRAGTKRRRA